VASWMTTPEMSESDKRIGYTSRGANETELRNVLRIDWRAATLGFGCHGLRSLDRIQEGEYGPIENLRNFYVRQMSAVRQNHALRT
jgi:hypothetical protein